MRMRQITKYHRDFQRDMNDDRQLLYFMGTKSQANVDWLPELKSLAFIGTKNWIKYPTAVNFVSQIFGIWFVTIWNRYSPNCLD